MCGRYALTRDEIRFRSRFVRGADQAHFSWEPRAEVAPTDRVPVIYWEADHLACGLTHWGLRLPWSKRPLINVRSDSLQAKPLYRELRARGRCLIPATGFFEWHNDGVRKVPVAYTLPEGVFCFAGLRLSGAASAPAGQPDPRAAIITVDANAVMRPVHDRMPAILRPDQYDDWLDPAVPFDRACAALASLRNDALAGTPAAAAPPEGEFDFGSRDGGR